MSHNVRIKEGYKKMEKEKQEIYFAHPFDKIGSKREAMIMKKLAEKYRVVNPFEGEDHLCEKYQCNNYYDNPCKGFAQDILERDLGQVDRCEALFAWIPKDVTMIGTIRELDRAIRTGKHVIVLCYKPNPFLLDANELYLSYQDFLDGKKHEWK